MTFPEAMEALETARGKKKRVSSKDLKKIAKEAKLNHTLAQKLWKTRNHDARVLATLVADPRRATPAEIEIWSRDLDNKILAKAFAKNYVAKTKFAKLRIEEWKESGTDLQKLVAKTLHDL